MKKLLFILLACCTCSCYYNEAWRGEVSSYQKFKPIKKDLLIGINKDLKGIWLMEYSESPTTRQIKIYFSDPEYYAISGNFIIIKNDDMYGIFIRKVEMIDNEEFSTYKRYFFKKVDNYEKKRNKLAIEDSLEFIKINWSEYE